MFDRARYYLRRLARAVGSGEDVTAAREMDRRATVRFSADSPALCRANGATRSKSVRIRDVSCTGVSLVLDRALPAGTLLTLEFPARTGTSVTTLLAYVKHSTARQAGGWMVGCAFAAELDDDTLRGFGVARAPAQPPDQRSWERQTTSGVIALFRPAASNGVSSPAEVLDLSPAGAGLRLEDRVEPGTLLNLELRGPAARPAVTILASVVYLSPHPNSGWVVGCNFIRELGEDDLQRLL